MMTQQVMMSYHRLSPALIFVSFFLGWRRKQQGTTQQHSSHPISFSPHSTTSTSFLFPFSFPLFLFSCLLFSFPVQFCVLPLFCFFFTGPATMSSSSKGKLDGKEPKDKEKDKKVKKRRMASSSSKVSSSTHNLFAMGLGESSKSRRVDKKQLLVMSAKTEFVSAFDTIIPENDITFTTQKRIHRTVEPNIPAKVMKQKLPPHVHDCLDAFAKDWKVSEYESRDKYGRGSVEEAPSDDIKSCKLTYDQEKPYSGDLIEVDKKVLTEFPVDTYISSLEESRFNIFRLHGMNTLRVSDRRPQAAPMSDMTGFQVLLEMKEFKMSAVEDVDVFYGSVALYNLSLDKVANRGRLSEFFHFTLTDSSRWGSETDARPGPISPESLARQAIFTIDRPSPDLCLLFRFEKILWGEVSHATDFYTRSQIKPKEYMKLRDEGQARAERLGKYSQSFVYGAIQLFPTENVMVVGKDRPLEHSITHLLRMNNGDMSDESIFSEIRSLIRKSGEDSKSFGLRSSRRSKPLPGKIVLQLREVKPGEEIKNRVTPSLVPISPFVSQVKKVIREIQHFTLLENESTPSPFLSYVHHLYIYPESLNFSSYDGSSSARNLCCEIQLKVNDVDETPPGLPVITGRAVMANLVTSAVTSVSYHEQRPHWFEEVRLSLPPDLLTNHHLLFTFKHIICAMPKGKKKDKGKDFEEISGYAWIRILDSDNSIMADGEKELPVAIELPQRYLSADPASVKWVEKQREVFSMRSKLISSIVPRDPVLGKYFIEFNQSHAQKAWANFTSSLKDLRSANRRSFVHFLPVLLNQLFRIVATEKDDISMESMHTIVHIAEQTGMIDEGGDKDLGFRHPLLTSYINTMFSNPDVPSKVEEPFHLRFLRLWTRRLTLEATNDATDQTFLRFIWFMFDIVVKSRIQYLCERKMLPFHTREGDPEDKEFGKVVTKLVKGLLASEIQIGLLGIAVSAKKPGLSLPGGLETSQTKMAMHVSDQLAFFIKDLIPLLSSSTLTDLILTFTEIDRNHPNSKLTVAKFEFLRIIADYEHYIPINHPPKNPSVGDPQRLVEEYSSRHVLTGFVIHDVLLILKSTQGDPNSEARTCALQLFVHLLYKHSVDDRYKSPEMQRSIAAIYFPFVAGLVEEERRSNLLTMSISNKILESDIQNILLAFLWVVKSVGSDYVRTWLLTDPDSNAKFFQILWKALDCFDPNRDRSRGETFLNTVRPTDAKSETELKAKEFSDEYNLFAMGVLSSSRSEPATSRAEPAPTPKDGGKLRKFRKVQAANEKRVADPLELQLHREVVLIMLECVWHMMLDLKDQVHIVIKFLVLLLKQNHSRQVLTHLFNQIRYFIVTYQDALFIQKTSYCGDLTLELMRYCNCYSRSIRGQASALLYLMFQRCWETSGHLVRMKLQSSVATAKLVGDVRVRGSGYLSSSLKGIARHAENDANVSVSFKEQLDDLFDKRLSEILTNVNLLQKWEGDPEMFADVLYQISSGWRDSPDIRFHWMNALATRHTSEGDFEEAGQCHFHEAGIIYTHLEALKPETAPVLRNPLGKGIIYSSLLRVAPNCDAEFVVECSPATAIAEGMCCSDTFTDKGFEKALSQSARAAEQVKLYETAIIAHRLVGISLNMRRDWCEMGNVYANAASWASGIETELVQSRTFCSYFRVFLYGNQFEHKSQSFIYKEVPGTKVSDLTSRLLNQYTEIFGEGKVTQLPTKWAGDPKELDSKKAHFQVGEVSPYLTEDELGSRISVYERQTNVQRFVYETRYSVDPNKKLSEVGLKSIGIIKTILTTSHRFPFVLKRILIVGQKEVRLGPVEANVEHMKARVQTLKSLVESECPSSSTLQEAFRFHTLNKGNSIVSPLDICKAFFTDPEGSSLEPLKILRGLFETFLEVSQKVLRVHEETMRSDQKEAHDEMAQAFEEIGKQMKSILQSGIGVGWVRST